MREIMTAEITVALEGEGYVLHWKGRPLKTDGGNPLLLPSEALAEGIANEWRAQELPKRKKETMPLTGLAYLLLDYIPANRQAAEEEVLQFAGTDTLCYRADNDSPLYHRQVEGWTPWVSWAERELGVRFTITQGIMPARQDARLQPAILSKLAALDDRALTLRFQATRLTGSFILGWAMQAGKIDADTAYRLGCMELLFQLESWGEDEEARERLGRVETQLHELERFAGLLGGY